MLRRDREPTGEGQEFGNRGLGSGLKHNVLEDRGRGHGVVRPRKLIFREIAIRIAVIAVKSSQRKRYNRQYY